MVLFESWTHWDSFKPYKSYGVSIPWGGGGKRLGVTLTPYNHLVAEVE